MGHTSTRKGSPVLLRIVPNTSHRKVMKPSQRSTSCCCSSSRTVKSFCRGTRDHVSLTGAGRGPGNINCNTVPTVRERNAVFKGGWKLPGLVSMATHPLTLGWGHSFSSSESCSVLVTFLFTDVPNLAWKIPRLWTGNVYGGGWSVCMLGRGRESHLPQTHYLPIPSV